MGFLGWGKGALGVQATHLISDFLLRTLLWGLSSTFCSNRILVSRGIAGLRHVASSVEHLGGYDVAFEH
jgi:hypothetical protein